MLSSFAIHSKFRDGHSAPRAVNSVRSNSLTETGHHNTDGITISLPETQNSDTAALLGHDITGIDRKGRTGSIDSHQLVPFSIAAAVDAVA